MVFVRRILVVRAHNFQVLYVWKEILPSFQMIPFKSCISAFNSDRKLTKESTLFSLTSTSIDTRFEPKATGRLSKSNM